MQKRNIATPFLWRPGEGCDAAALARLRRAFPRPGAPMGEAWFMGETRRMFTELRGDLATLPIEDINKPLREIASGTICFGEMREWNEWYHYILAQTLPRAHETYAFDSYIEHLITAFFALYPEGATREPYKGFHRDALDTLGRVMMIAQCWDGERVRIGEFLHRDYNPRAEKWFWHDASGDFSASMLFCLKYLATEEIGPWLQSVFAIPDPHWRAQIMVWFVGAHPLLVGDVADPSDFGVGDWPSLHFEGAHLHDCAPREFLPRANRDAALASVPALMNDDVHLDWLLSMAAFDYLENELMDLPDRFRSLYIAPAAR